MVTRDVEPYAIIGGNPAKLIRKRSQVNSEIISAVNGTAIGWRRFRQHHHIEVAQQRLKSLAPNLRGLGLVESDVQWPFVVSKAR